MCGTKQMAFSMQKLAQDEHAPHDSVKNISQWCGLHHMSTKSSATSVSSCARAPAPHFTSHLVEIMIWIQMKLSLVLLTLNDLCVCPLPLRALCALEAHTQVRLARLLSGDVPLPPWCCPFVVSLHCLQACFCVHFVSWIWHNIFSSKLSFTLLLHLFALIVSQFKGRSGVVQPCSNVSNCHSFPIRFVATTPKTGIFRCVNCVNASDNLWQNEFCQRMSAITVGTIIASSAMMTKWSTDLSSTACFLHLWPHFDVHWLVSNVLTLLSKCVMCLCSISNLLTNVSQFLERSLFFWSHLHSWHSKHTCGTANWCVHCAPSQEANRWKGCLLSYCEQNESTRFRRLACLKNLVKKRRPSNDLKILAIQFEEENFVPTRKIEQDILTRQQGRGE